MKYLDTNIFIYILDKSAKKVFREKSEKILKKVEKKELVVISFINLMEVLWWCEKYLKDRIKDVYDMILSYKNLKILNVDPQILEGAILFKNKYNLELNDCIALASMTKLEIKEIYTNDTGFDKIDWVKRKFG